MKNKGQGEQTPQLFTPKIKIIIAIATVLTIAISFTLGYFVKVWTTPKELSTLEWIIENIDAHYYSEEDGVIKKFTEEDYADGLIDGLLDKYSDYFTSQEYADVISTNKGNNFGTGLGFLKDSDTNAVFRITWNSPADKAGLKDGDVIVGGKAQIGERVNFATKTDVLTFLSQRKENEEFTLFYTRNGGEEQLVSISKKVFVTAFVKYVDSEIDGVFRSEGSAEAQFQQIVGGDKSLPLDTGYVALSEFDGDAVQQMGKALTLLKQRGRTKLILDLRKNGGGDMKVLCGIASYFIRKSNALVAYTIDKEGKGKEFKSERSKFIDEITSISVIADGYSASASECLIGAMAYYKDCFDINKLVVEKTDGVAKTFGKGIMQTTYQRLTTGEALKLTTAYVYQPDRTTCIHNKGILAVEGNGADVGQGLALAISVV